MKYDVCVIGSGVAGMTAAIYLKRANINVLLIENKVPGGQIVNTASIENYPGFKEIDGSSLASNIFMQTQELEIPFKHMNIIDIKNKKDKKIVVSEKDSVECQKVIIATGRKPKLLDVPGEMKFAGRGISWCAICDGALFKNQEIVVIGGGNSALEESLFLTTLVKKVILVHRRNEFRGDIILHEQILNNKKIDVMWDSVVSEFKGDNTLKSVIIKNVKTNKEKELKVNGCFIFIGFEPATKIFDKLKITDERGYIKVNSLMETKKKGIYAIGDVIKKDVYQIATAIGEGATAAVNISRSLEE